MKVAIVGSRGFWDLDLVGEYVNGLPPGDSVVSGGARGVDVAAERAATLDGRDVLSFPANWALLGKRAGFVRNVQIVDACDRLVAFWDGQSRGTKHSIDLAKRAGKPVLVITGRE